MGNALEKAEAKKRRRAPPPPPPHEEVKEAAVARLEQAGPDIPVEILVEIARTFSVRDIARFAAVNQAFAAAATILMESALREHYRSPLSKGGPYAFVARVNEYYAGWSATDRYALCGICTRVGLSLMHAALTANYLIELPLETIQVKLDLPRSHNAFALATLSDVYKYLPTVDDDDITALPKRDTVVSLDLIDVQSAAPSFDGLAFGGDNTLRYLDLYPRNRFAFQGPASARHPSFLRLAFKMGDKVLSIVKLDLDVGLQLLPQSLQWPQDTAMFWSMEENRLALLHDIVMLLVDDMQRLPRLHVEGRGYQRDFSRDALRTFLLDQQGALPLLRDLYTV
jgi:hypothetical protein